MQLNLFSSRLSSLFLGVLRLTHDGSRYLLLEYWRLSLLNHALEGRVFSFSLLWNRFLSGSLVERLLRQELWGVCGLGSIDWAWVTLRDRLMNGRVRLIVWAVLLSCFQFGLLPDLLQKQILLLLDLEMHLMILHLALDQLLMHRLGWVEVLVECLSKSIYSLSLVGLLRLGLKTQVASLAEAAIAVA